MKDKTISDNFWKLYGAGTLHHPVSDFEAMTAEQWERLKAIAKSNKLSGLVLDGISFVPADKKPSKAFLSSWVFELAAQARGHWDHNLVIADLFHRWREAGLHPVLLKGQGFARMYPTPTMRMLGDVDVCMLRGEFDRAMEVVKALPLDNDEFPDSGKHIEFAYRHVAIELHRVSARTAHNKKIERQYQQWSEQELRATTVGFHINEKGMYADDGEWIATPPLTFNALYTFLHLWEHMHLRLSHIRSFADWILLLHNHKGQFDLVELEKRLRQFDLLRYWQILGCFVVRYMGVDPGDIPFYDPAKMRNHEKYYRFFTNEIAGLNYDNSINRPISMGNMRRIAYTFDHYYNRVGVYPVTKIIKDLAHVVGKRLGLVDDPDEIE